jgi:hypothetical protein
VIVRSKVNKMKSDFSLYLQRVNARLFVKKRTRTSTLTSSRSYFYLWCTHTMRHSHQIQREQNGESWGVCAGDEKWENARERERGREREREVRQRQRVRESESQRDRERRG